MIRFVDLSDAYWTDPELGSPCCAFLCTGSDTFLQINGSQVFIEMAEVEEHPQAKRLKRLMPDGFFEENSQLGT